MNNKRTLAALIGLTAGMFAFSFALVPLYDLFCDITGLNGKVTGPSGSAEQAQATGRPLSVRFITEKGNGIPWDFSAVEPQVTIEVGRPQTVYFRVHNRSEQRVVARAIPSVSPGPASRWLRKTECFCFQQQVLEAGATADLAMNFYFTKDLPTEYRDVLIAYTLYEIPPES